MEMGLPIDNSKLEFSCKTPQTSQRKIKSKPKFLKSRTLVITKQNLSQSKLAHQNKVADVKISTFNI